MDGWTGTTGERRGVVDLGPSWVEIDVTIADAAGELARGHRAAHSGIDTTDYLIAAAAESVGARGW